MSKCNFLKHRWFISIVLILVNTVISYYSCNYVYNDNFPYIEFILALLGINLTIMTLVLALKDANHILKYIWKTGKYQSFMVLVQFEIIGVIFLPLLFYYKEYIFIITNLSTLTIASIGYSLMKMIKFNKMFEKENEDELDTVYKKNINLIADILIELKDEIKKK